ncbi:nuclear protein MDM1 isoform X2 [Dendrobates tinctorius]|uniref:nuclear protein MDM1 isoform X2 n=1 Tax=Dendrobates tinctorius TaxID=92724 RepID=UPI003CC9FFCA
MPVRFKGLSEYDRNFKWKSWDEDQTEMSRWAGLPSDELGITREPNFPSKRRVLYYNPQIAKSFHWKENNALTSETSSRAQNGKTHTVVEEKLHTPDAPRSQKKSRSQSTVPRKVPDNGSSAVLRIKSADDLAAAPVKQPVNDSAPKNKEREKTKSAQVPGDAKQPRDRNGIHRVLQKKAGLNVAAAHHPLKVSEYRRQFEKKSPTDNSPLLAAEHVIHNKNQSVPPFKTINVKTDTEYKSQFKGSPPAKGPKLRKYWEDKPSFQYDREHSSPKRKDKKRDISSFEPGLGYMDKSGKEQEEKGRKIIKEKIIQQVKMPKYYRKVKTEYSANFLSPSEFKYKDGAWVTTKNQVHDQDPSLSVGSIWVAEVKELREKAEYYRRRAQGTHFSREHLNQIISNNNRMWDMSTNSSSEEDLSRDIKALDLAGLQTSSKKEKLQQSPTKVEMQSNTGNLGVSDASTLPVRRKLVWDEYDNAPPTENIEPLPIDTLDDEMEEEEDHEEEDKTTEQHFENNRGERSMKKTFDAKSRPSEEQSDISSVSVVEGRLPTPKLKTYGQVQRTHHDLTTPATGGALLVSPSKDHDNSELKHKKSPKKDYSPKKYISNGLNDRKANKNDEDQPVKSPPVAGLMTVDPLPLREDPWPTLQICSKTSPAAMTSPTSKPVEKPFVPSSWQWSPSCRIHGTLRDPEFQHNDDRLSQISARSAASSSLASEVLERAQKRKEDFWGKK